MKISRCLIFYTITFLTSFTNSLNITSCYKNCSTFEKSKQNPRKLRYNVQFESCQRNISNFHSLSPPAYKSYYEIIDDKIQIVIIFRPRNDATSKYLQGVKISVDIENELNFFKDQFSVFYCLQSVTISPRQGVKAYFNFTFFDHLSPGDRFITNLSTIPENKQKIFCNSKKNKIESNCDRGLNSRSHKLRKIPNCKNGNFHLDYCTLKNQINLQINSYKCFDEIILFVNNSLVNKAYITLQHENISFNKYKRFYTIQKSQFNHSVKLPIYDLDKNLEYFVLIEINGYSFTNLLWKLSFHDCIEYQTYIIILSIFLPILVLFAFMFCYKHYVVKQKNHNNKKVLKIYTNTVIKKSSKIYVGFLDSRKAFQELVYNFSCHLQENLGFEVQCELWNEVHLSKSAWIENILQQCDKFIIIWSLESTKLFENLSNDEFHEYSSFLDVLIQIKAELLRNMMSKSRLVSVYFNKNCCEMIPEWFCKLIDKHFYLMDQFHEFYIHLTNQKRYFPGVELVLQFGDFDKTFRDLISQLEKSEIEEKKESEELVCSDLKINHLNIIPPDDGGDIYENLL